MREEYLERFDDDDVGGMDEGDLKRQMMDYEAEGVFTLRELYTLFHSPDAAAA